MTQFNRRDMLKATAVGGGGFAALAYSPKPTLAAGDWTVNSPSTVSNNNGELSSLEIPASGFSFSLDYSGLGSGAHSIKFTLEAKLSSASSFDTVFYELFDVEGDSGTVTESKLSTSFPVDLLANTSMTASDFAEVNMGEVESTTVDLRASFEWSDSEYSASDSSVSQFDVNVKHAASPVLTADSLTVNDPPTVSNYDGKLSSLELPKDDFSFILDYSGLGSGSHSINFELEAKLASSSSFDTVFSETFDVSGESGTVSESKLSTSFPVDLLANTSMTASDFEEPNSGDTEVTTVDFRVSFNWSDGEHSASDSTNDSFDVSVTHQAQPSLTANSLTVNDPSVFSNDNGEITSLEIPKEDFSFSLDYNNFETGTHSINFALEAKLASSSSFDTVFSETFDVSGESGTVSESKLSTSFPVDLLANTSMSASDFEEPNAGETEITTVDFRVSFNWSGSEYSASDSTNDSFDVTVENTSPEHAILEDFEDQNLSGWSSDSAATVETPGYSGDYSFRWGSDGRNSEWASRTVDGSGQPVSLTFYFREQSGSTGHGLRLKNSNGNYECGAGTDNPAWIISTGGDPSTFDSSISSYNTWTEVKMEFDWSNGNVRFTFTQKEGNGKSNQSNWMSMGEGKDIAVVELWPQHKNTWGQGNNNKEARIDYIKAPY